MENELIKCYFIMGLKYDEILCFLGYLHNIFLSIRTLKRRLRSMHLYRRRNYTNLDEIINYIRRQVQTSSQLHGYRWMHLKCLKNSYVVTQETIRQLLGILDPEGVQFRQRKRLRRRQYKNKGPNYMWHVDGNDKLKPYGIGISGCIDGFSRHIIWMKAASTNSNSKIVGGYYLDSIKRLGGYPRTVRADLGTENVQIEKMQNFLKECQNINDGNAAFIYGRSTANQRIESWWSILRKHNIQFWINLFQTLKDDNKFNGSDIDKSLIQFSFLQIIQEELDQICLEWNTHVLRASRNSISPMGRPIVLYNMPQIYSAKDYLFTVNDEQLFEDCEQFCIHERFRCDRDILSFCNLIMIEKNLQHSQDPYKAVDLYVTLRNEIYSQL